MKKIALLVLLTAALASCRSFQINTVSSIDALKNDSTGVFTVENDSLIISYNFKGNNAPVNVEVYNKLNEPLFINWERSALVVGDKAYSYVDDHLKISGDISASSLDYGRRSNITYTDASINGKIKLSKNESFLPPHSKTGRTVYALQLVDIKKIDKSAFKVSMLKDIDGITPVYSKTADFNSQDSPLKFKSYLTFYTLKNNVSQPFYYEQNFFVSNVTKLNQNPKNVEKYNHAPGDILVNSKSTGFGKTMAAAGVAGVIGAAVVVDSSKK